MKTLRSLILLLLLSALGSASQAHSMTAVDGYLDQASAQQSLLPAQELEGDEPDGAASSQSFASPSLREYEFARLHSPARVANYSDFLARAPPHDL